MPCSKYLLRHSDNDRLCWQIEHNGIPLSSGKAAQDIAPRQSATVRLTKLPELSDKLWSQVRIIQPEATAWPDAGFMRRSIVILEPVKRPISILMPVGALESGGI
ncbi:beta-galactosidase domain 4-containing protein [Izhakiella capsodis]|uniref:beta-galactosidase domain 4-containing protein n=1 Tax=Izhakiella capsodis TaxID=1367852 RepID=UPI0038B3049B